MMLSPEVQTFIAQCRVKAANGSITLAEMKQAIIYLREQRKSAQPLKHEGGGKTKKQSGPIDTDALLNELG